MIYVNPNMNFTARDFADFFKAVFNANVDVFCTMMDGIEIAQAEIAIENEGIK